MSVSRRVLLMLPIAAALVGHTAVAAEAVPAHEIERFYAVLLAVMKAGRQLSFAGRYARLAPAIAEAYNLPLMTRLAIGPGWRHLSADQQQRLTDAFTRYTVSEYASRFDGFGGERFEVTSEASANPNGLVVASRMVKPDGETISFNYLMRKDASGAWKIIDVYVSGSISELATRRAEFTAVLQRAGAEGLVQELDRRIAALRTG
jgi:phospholipid transport system substrate-binding protein